MHTLGGKADDDGLLFFSSFSVRFGFLTVSVSIILFYFFYNSYIYYVIYTFRLVAMYRFGFSFDSYETAFNWTTTAPPPLQRLHGKMPPVIGSLVVLITCTASYSR